jgi:hypothetical protein
MLASLPSPSNDLPQSEARWITIRHLTLVLIGVFFLTTIRSGHSWGDDFAQYLLQAKNIAELAPGADTGYIYNPQNAIVGPKSYPSAFPALLAPVVALFGSHLILCKAVGVLLFLAGLAIAGRLFAVDLPARATWICVAIVGFSPLFWDVKDHILSEHMFLPCWYAALLVADDWYRRGKAYGNPFLHGCLLGGLIFVTTATRTVGIVLIPAVVACEVLIARRLTRVGITALVTAVSLILIERCVQPSSGAGYLEQLRGITGATLLENLYSDTVAFSLLWQNPYWNGVRKFAGLVLGMIAIAGFLRANWRRPTPMGIASLAYFVLIVLWPSADGVRMSFPLLPGFVFYVLLGLSPSQSRENQSETAADSSGAEIPTGRNPGLTGTGLRWWQPLGFLSRRTTDFCSAALLVFSLLSFGAAYSAADFGPVADGVETGPAREMFEFVRNHTRADEVCLFFKPRALALYTDRRSAAFPIGTGEQQFWDYADSIGATIVILRDEAPTLFREDQTSEMRLPYGGTRLEEVFHNSKFHVYRIAP